jgi:hypothetical protein
MCEKCKVTIGSVGAAAGRKAQREHDAKVAADALRAYHNGQPARAGLTATDYAQRVLMVAGGIVLLASMNFLMHALLVTLAALFAVLCGVAAVVTVRSRRRLRTVIPAPLPAARPRTTVTAVQVRAIGSRQAQAGLPVITGRRTSHH